MNRRKFLAASLGATAGGVLVASDLASAKTYFLPPIGGWRPLVPPARADLWQTSGPWRVPEPDTIVACIRPMEIFLNDFVAVNGRMHRVIGIENGADVMRLELSTPGRRVGT